ncbi:MULTISPECIES: RDD family protein [unclassified Snodgrassella]|uniref:RDD family protein n=1 Tax=unclassified Snodgrassella TaxID=2625236 RepID=UPI0018DE9F4B|nr:MULTISPECIES: RDD family protein [unclassified Snodgrassella]MBI0159402.1 RDD family protein [Snodgrassella sp. W6238H11]MBI0161430.1 RDD family protein [Snodgrassella sp. W6238H14]
MSVRDFTKIQNLNKDGNTAQDYVAATPLKRLIAGIINILLFFIPANVVYIFFHTKYIKAIFAIPFVCLTLASIIFLMILPFWQCFWMWKRGQSIGKKIMGIKVIRLDNRSPDFWNNVIKREFIYYIYMYILARSCFYSQGLQDVFFYICLMFMPPDLFFSVETAPLVPLLLLIDIFNLMCLYRLFSNKFLSVTLQDKLAKTRVVQNVSNNKLII